MKNNKVYCYTNIHNNKKYIGQTIASLKIRADCGRDYEQCPKFWKAIQKYGWDSFIPEILAENITAEKANELEAFYINKFDTINNGYNCTTGGKSGFKFTEES